MTSACSQQILNTGSCDLILISFQSHISHSGLLSEGNKLFETPLYSGDICESAPSAWNVPFTPFTLLIFSRACLKHVTCSQKSFLLCVFKNISCTSAQQHLSKLGLNTFLCNNLLVCPSNILSSTSTEERAFSITLQLAQHLTLPGTH